MPNHVRNKVKMTGIVNLPLFTTETDKYTKVRWYRSWTETRITAI